MPEAEFHLKRRIPPKSIDELAQELMSNTDISAYDARALATEMHTAMMEEIYRLARVGEEYERREASRKDLMIHWLERDPREPFHG